MTPNTAPIKVNCSVTRETDLAWLVKCGRREAWIAKSQIINYTTADNLFGGPTVVAISIPTWLAREKGFAA
jgi:hypothetical protein